jgi:hypothetical protein
MESQQQHTMELAKQYSSVAEEWYCPSCGRRLILQWPPNYKRIILDPGNENVNHNGGPSSFQVDVSIIQQVKNLLDEHSTKALPPPFEDSLAPWIRYLETIDLEAILDSDMGWDVI